MSQLENSAIAEDATTDVPGAAEVQVGRSQCGWGVFAGRPFDEGEVVAVVGGHLIDDPNYDSDYCIDLGGPYSLEPQEPFLYLNHCCDPNCALFMQDDGEPEERTTVPFIALEALRTIQPGEELTIDYAWPADGAVPCLCGSPECRGWIVAEEEIYLLLHRLAEDYREDL